MKKSTETPYVTIKVQRAKIDIIRAYAQKNGMKLYKVIDNLLTDGMKKQRMNGN